MTENETKQETTPVPEQIAKVKETTETTKEESTTKVESVPNSKEEVKSEAKLADKKTESRPERKPIELPIVEVETISDLNTLKEKVKETYEAKEKAFAKRQEVQKQVREYLSILRKAKSRRNNYTKQVQDSKDRRSELNEEVKAKTTELITLKKEARGVSNKAGIRIDPTKTKKEIEAMEMKIETGAVNFKEEQKLMKIIKEKRKELEGLKGTSEVYDKVTLISAELDKLKEKADDTHKKIQTKAKTSQEQHEELLFASKELRKMRTAEEDVEKAFLVAKATYEAYRAQLPEEERQPREAKKKSNFAAKKKADDKVKAQQKEIISKGAQAVEDKIKKGKKLTTEDILLMQAAGK